MECIAGNEVGGVGCWYLIYCGSLVCDDESSKNFSIMSEAEYPPILP